MANPSTNNVALKNTSISTSLDPTAFDDFISAQGIPLVHYRAMRCPVGMTDRFDERIVHPDHAGCSNGFLYTKAGTLVCVFTGNTNSMDQRDVGVVDGATVQVTSSRFYDGTETETEIAQFDRFYLADEAISVPHWQLVEAHITGHDRLSFPAISVTDLVDSSNKTYHQGDFDLVNGQIVWKQGGLNYDPTINKGTIYSVRYRYRPYWYVSRMVHQIRIAKVETALERKTVIMPQQFVLQREYIFEVEKKDNLATDPNSPRQVASPADGPFGAR